MKTSPKPLINRPSVASGRFFSAHGDKLETEVSELIRGAQELCNFKIDKNSKLLALMVPHAGYVFSGKVAASAFLSLKDIEPRKRVFLIGSSHHTDFNGASIYNIGHYQTPLGKISVDLDLANKITNNSELINFVEQAHANEHSIEVQLPFIQYLWKSNFEIIPVIIAGHSKELCKKLAKELEPYLNEENLFVISSDLSHYPKYGDAVKVDKQTINALTTGNPDILYEQIQKNTEECIPNLSTSMCGWTSVLTFMYMTERKSNISYTPILYKNSGDIKPYGDTDHVVGYQSLAITQKRNEDAFKLSSENKQSLINIALKSILRYHNKGSKLVPKIKNLSKPLLMPGGAFVSVYVNNELRGCIGQMQSKERALIHIVSDVAVSAAFHDNRFERLTNEELNNIAIEISVLTPLQKINSLNEITMGRHGIYIKKGFQSGTFLPQVANKTNWTVEEFVGNCSKNKAGLGWSGWKEAELYTYEAIVFRSE